MSRGRPSACSWFVVALATCALVSACGGGNASSDSPTPSADASPEPSASPTPRAPSPSPTPAMASPVPTPSPSAVVDPDPWPTPGAPASLSLSLVADGRVVSAGDRLTRETGPAGLDAEVIWRFVLTNLSDESWTLHSETWLSHAHFELGGLAQDALAPQASTAFEVRFSPGALDSAAVEDAELALPFAEASFVVRLRAVVPSPLRIVGAGTGGALIRSDDLGRSFVEDTLPGLPDARRQTLSWGGGRFLLTYAEDEAWGSPGRYMHSTDGERWAPSLTSDAFWVSGGCAWGLDQFMCARGGGFSFTQTGGAVLHGFDHWQLLMGVTFAADRWVAVGRAGRRLSTADGDALIDFHEDEALGWFEAVAAAGRTVVAGGGRQQSKQLLAASRDEGHSWEVLVDDPMLGGILGLVHDGDRFIAVVDRRWDLPGPHPTILTSNDGFAWQSHMTEPEHLVVEGLRVLPDGSYLGFTRPWQQPSVLYRSVDALRWEPVFTLSDSTHIHSLAVEGADRLRPTLPELPEGPPDLVGDDPPPPVDAPDDAETPPCRTPLVVHHGDTLVGDAAIALGHSRDRGAALEATLTVRNPCELRARFLSHPSQWWADPRFSLVTLPPVLLEPGAEAELGVRFSPREPGLVQGALRIPYNQPDSPLHIDFTAEVLAPPRVLFVGDGGHRVTLDQHGASVLHDSFETMVAHGDSLQRGACWGNGVFLAVGGNVDGRSWRSVDGEDFTAHIGEHGVYADCAFDASRFVSRAGGRWLRSTDGLSWEAGDSQGFVPQHIRALAAGGGHYVAVGDEGRVIASDDGLTTTHEEILGIGGLGAAAYGSGAFVAAGDGGSVATSTDGGLSWTAQQVGNGARFGAVVHHAGGFLIGNGAQIFRSADGLSWGLVNGSSYLPLAGYGSLVLAVSGDGQGIAVSEDSGFSWTPVHSSTGGLGLSEAAVEGLP